MNRSIKIVMTAALLLLVGTLLSGGRQIAYGAGQTPSANPQQPLEQSSAAGPNDTITLTDPAPNTVIAESDDYATRMLGDPWDMVTSSGDLRNLSGLDDIDQPFGYDAPTISNGVWSANMTRAGGSSFDLQYNNYANSYSSLGEKDGQNYPIDSTRYRRVLMRIHSAGTFLYTIVFYKNYNSAPTGNSGVFTLQPGWNIVSIDMQSSSGGGTGNWTANGPYSRLMVQAIQGVVGSNVQVDWARLTPNTTDTVRIVWNYDGTPTNQVHLYLSTSADANTDNELALATVAANVGAYSWDTTGVAPGSYYIHAEVNGAVSSIGPLVVDASPIVRIDAPSPLSGEDFAYASLGAGWDSSNSQQFQQVVSVANLVFGPLELRGVPTTGDPELSYINQDPNHHIDTTRYRYYSQRMDLEAPASRTDSPFNAGPRLLWDTGSHTFPTTKLLLWPYARYEQRFWDLPNTPMVNGSWTGTLNYFRMDPNEDDGTYGRPLIHIASFGLTNAHLTTVPIAGHTGLSGSGLYGTVIRWTVMQGSSGTVDLYRDNNNSGFDGVPIVTGLPLTQGTYAWDTSSVPGGTYYVYAVADNGTSNTKFYSLAPVLVDQSQPATLFSDVPNNYFAVDYINRLAMLNIIGGTSQPDTSVNFHPSNTATRAQLSKIVVLAAGWTLLNPPGGTFEDVPVGSTFYQYVETAASHGVIGGYPCGGPNEPCDTQNRPYYRPGNNVTRAQTAKMVTISRGWSVVTPNDPTFADMPYDGTTGSLYSYVETVVSHSIVNGYPCGGAGEPCDPQSRPYYRPGNSVTRAQLSKMISLALDSPLAKSDK